MLRRKLFAHLSAPCLPKVRLGSCKPCLQSDMDHEIEDFLMKFLAIRVSKDLGKLLTRDVHDSILLLFFFNLFFFSPQPQNRSRGSAGSCASTIRNDLDVDGRRRRRGVHSETRIYTKEGLGERPRRAEG